METGANATVIDKESAGRQDEKNGTTTKPAGLIDKSTDNKESAVLIDKSTDNKESADVRCDKSTGEFPQNLSEFHITQSFDKTCAG